MIPCAPKHLKREYHRYLQKVGSQIETEGPLEIEKVIFRVLAQNTDRQQS